MLCFQRNWFRADLCEMARSCSKLQQVDRLRKYDGSSTIKVFYWGWLRVPEVRMRWKKNNHANRLPKGIVPRRHTARRAGYSGKIFEKAGNAEIAHQQKGKRRRKQTAGAVYPHLPFLTQIYVLESNAPHSRETIRR